MGDVIKFTPPEAKSEHSAPKKINPIKKWAQRIALGTAMVGGGYQVGHERGRAEVMMPEQERIEQDAEELADKLDEMISLLDELHSIGVIINREDKQRQLDTDLRVNFAHALGMTSDFNADHSQKVTWQKSMRADEIYKKIEAILERDFPYSDIGYPGFKETIRSAAQKIMQDKGK